MELVEEVVIAVLRLERVAAIGCSRIPDYSRAFLPEARATVPKVSHLAVAHDTLDM